VWNETWQPLIDAGRLSVLGVVQEQHAERARLYCQWRQFRWPVVQDALNLLQIKVVPLAIAVDEQGVVVSYRADPEFLGAWMAGTAEATADSSDRVPETDPQLLSPREKFLWQDAAGRHQAIADYEALIADTHADSQRAHFEVGVCYRDRFEVQGDPGDFQQAIDHWTRALQIDPNQYIYRRRIQQYGARLGKPYPFYDWVRQAQQEIRERGEQPVPLRVAISGAEIARPLRTFEAVDTSIDWESVSRIVADERDYVGIRVVAVPSLVKPGEATRVHVLVSPGDACKWNNESQPTTLVLRPVEGAELSQNVFEHEPVGAVESSETRRFEFEVRLDADHSRPVTIRGSVLINICVVESGVCTYLRKPFELILRPDRRP
jgi:hypothetical protein